MMPSEEHPTELLLDLLEGELQGVDAARAQEHVDSCEHCAEELVALRHLLDSGDGGSLTEIERARLHRDVLKEIQAPASDAADESSPWARLAPYLGTAAVLALLAVGVMTFDMTGGDDTGGAGGDTVENHVEQPGSDGGADEDRVAPEGASRADSGDATAEDTAQPNAASAGKALASSQPFPRPRPTFQATAGDLAAEDLAELGRSTAPLTAFARSYVVDDVAALGEASLVELSKGVGGEEARLIRRCGRQILRTGGYSAIAAFGGFGSMDGQEVLLLAFAWTPEPSGELDRFMVWAWPKGNCERALEYRMGYINP